MVIYSLPKGFSLKKIKLTQGKVAFVDDRDYEWLIHYNWITVKDHHRDKYYAISYTPREKGKRRQFSMHRLIMKVLNPPLPKGRGFPY